MRISMDEKAGTYTLVPVTTDERELVHGLLDSLNTGTEITYQGRHGSGDDPDFSLDFRFGATDFRLAPSDKASLGVLRGMRDMCFFGSGALTFLREGQEGDMRTIVCTGGFCATCGCSVVNFISNKDQVTCASCAQTCAHEFSEEAVVLSPEFGTCVARVCKKCMELSSESKERLRGMPRLRRLQEVQEREPSVQFRIGQPGDPFLMTVDEAVALSDRGVVPEGYRELAETNSEVRHVFDALAESLRTSM